MSQARYRIEYGPSALRDLDSLPAKIRQQILKKIDRLESGMHGDIKRLQQRDVAYRLRMGDYRILFDMENEVIAIRRIGHRKSIVPKTIEPGKIDVDLRRARRQLLELREQSETIADYLDVLEARVKDAGKRRVSHDEVKKRYR